MASYQPMPLPEPMNASPHHSKVKVSITLADRIFVAGDYVAGKMELECRADKGLGIGVILVELFAIQELSSRDHSATSTFLHSKRLFQGPGLPPSNAVHAHPQPGYPVLPPSYYQARRGLSTFLFRIPIPETSPSSIIFGTGLGRVRYELRASVGVFWKGERRLVIDNHTLDVISAFPHELVGVKEPEGVIIGENGKLWMLGRLIGPVIIAGESACIELQVKNHSNKKNTGLSLSLNRTLVLPGSTDVGKQTMELSDTLTHVPFRGPEYIIPPGAEGVANLVFDVPRDARGVRGGVLDGDEIDPPRSTESLFEIRCSVDVKMSMGFGNKDLVVSIPVVIVHPKTVPPEVLNPPPPPAMIPYPPPQNVYSNSPLYPPVSISPLAPFVVDQNHVWLPPPTPIPVQAYPVHPHQYLMSPAPQGHALMIPPSSYGPYINRPVSAGGNVSVPDPFTLPASGLPITASGNSPIVGLPPPSSPSAVAANTSAEMEVEEGKGQRALRVSHHLRLSSRTRSVSPQSHRFPTGLASADAFNHSTPMQKPVSDRQLPQPPMPAPPILQDRFTNLSLSPPQKYANTMVHSPRPQLTPKHSFYNEWPKSESVEVLERMADVVDAQAKDLSGDIPNDEELQKGGPLANAHREVKSPEVDSQVKATDKEKKEAEMNKTLPAPPVPSGKITLASPPPRPPLESLFENSDSKSAPPLLPFDKTPPTPTLTAVLPKRYPRSNLNNFLAPNKGESGLDALERRLLAEVGTRKFDESNPKNDDSKRPDVRDVLSGGVGPIDIPTKAKSPEPLNDSAISSLTLANDHRSVDGDNNDNGEENNVNVDMIVREEFERADSDLDLEVEARTHRGGSRSVSGDERGHSTRRLDSEMVNGTLLSVRMRYRREADTVPTGSTQTRLSGGSGKSGKSRDKDRRSTGKKKDRATKEERAKTKTEAKGRVAAWLGGVIPAEPLEETIPPSPSVTRQVESVLREATPVNSEAQPNGRDLVASPPPPVVDGEEHSDEKDVSRAPNPRSSGFVPIHTLQRGTMPRHPAINKEMTVVEESRKVTDMWREAATNSTTPTAPAKPVDLKPLAVIPPRPTPQSVRTDRRVSPPSKSFDLPAASAGRPLSKPAGTAAARNVWGLPDPPSFVAKSKSKAAVSPPPVPPPKPDDLKRAKLAARARDFPALPERKPDPGVSYDVRSARGGRGGKVTSVTAMWASFAANNAGSGNGPPIKPKPDFQKNGGRKKLSDSRPASNSTTSRPAPARLPGKIALPGLVTSDSAGNGSSDNNTSRSDVPNGLRGQLSSKPIASQVETVEKSGPVRLPKKPLSAVNLAQLNAKNPIMPSLSKSSDASLPTRGLFAGDPKSRAGPGKTTPNNLSTPSSAGGLSIAGTSAAATAGAGAKTNGKPMIKSPSVPAVISSSHAVPVLSSTASLARPAGASPPPRVLTSDIVNRTRDNTKSDRPLIPPPIAVKFGVGSSVPTAIHSSSTPIQPPAKSPPPDLAFGQARLRDLIKKYQSQAT